MLTPAFNNRLVSITSIIFVFFIFFLPTNSFSQSCFNAGFESSTHEGISTFLGGIDSKGNVIIQTPGPGIDRHRIVHISEGNDPIADRYCAINKILPVVPRGGGQYALRLGNEKGGSKAERIIIEFTVTPELNFFLLRYAVVLEDPNHDPFEQPRFELRILDENGNVFPCGEYSVKAGKGIPGFEECGSWRVRPWTTAGFELQSFLGQTIQIEILTTDCSKGGHGGYAYIDASCRPLNIELEGYCPEGTSASLVATDGFEKYAWSTGDTTSKINITNLVPGTIYSVKVTSATGCTLELTDTLPPLEEIRVPKFNTIQDTTLCRGNKIWITPNGENIVKPFSKDLGYSADSFLIVPRETKIYIFTATDEYGCITDTLEFTIKIDTISKLVSINSIVIDSTSCFGTSDGKISLDTDAKEIRWNNGQEGLELSSLSSGNYGVTLTDEFGCWISKTLTVPSPKELRLSNFEVKPVSCQGEDDGAITIFPSGGNGQYIVNNYLLSSNSFSTINLSSGVYNFSVIDRKACKSEAEIFVPEPDKLVLNTSQDSVSCTGYNDGKARIEINGGTSPYNIIWNDSASQNTLEANKLFAGNYSVTIIDKNQCTKTSSVQVLEPLPLEIKKIVQDSVSCHNSSDGEVNVIVSGGSPQYEYSWSDNSNQNTQRAIGLPQGIFFVTVKDKKGCSVFDSINVLAPKPLIIQLTQDSVSCHGGNDGIISANSTGGNENYEYLWQNVDSNIFYLNNLEAGIYKVTVVDSKNCMESSEIKVEEPNPIEVSIKEQLLPKCQEDLPGMTIIAPRAGNGGFQFIWGNGESSDTIKSYESKIFDYLVIDRKGCEFKGKAEVKTLDVRISSTGEFVNDQNAICLGSKLELEVNANNQLSDVFWQSTNTLPCNNCSNFTLSPEDSTQYQVIGTDIYNCKDTATIYIPVNTIELDFEMKADFLNNRPSVCYGKEVALKAISEPELASVEWNSRQNFSCDNCQETVIRPSETDFYTLYGTSINGCSAEVKKTIEVNKVACEQFIPNIFSPNNDGINDYFFIPSSLSIELITYMRIFDRWGNQVFEVYNAKVGDVSSGWDGTFKDDSLPKGVYIYVIKVEFFDGSKYTYTSDLTLMR